jgi:hypothetical protein
MLFDDATFLMQIASSIWKNGVEGIEGVKGIKGIEGKRKYSKYYILFNRTLNYLIILALKL